MNELMNNVMTVNPCESFMLPDMAAASGFATDDLAEDMEGLQMSFLRAKIPGGGVTQFEMPGDDPERPTYTPTLTGVILFNHPANAYWPEGEEPSDDNPPLCQSMDGKTGYGDPGGACVSCALNKFGSASKGNGKACKNMRTLYLLRSGDVMPILLNLPPTSIKPFGDFLNNCFMMRHRATYGSILEIALKSRRATASPTAWQRSGRLQTSPARSWSRYPHTRRRSASRPSSRGRIGSSRTRPTPRTASR